MILKLQQAFLPDKLSPSAFSAQRLEQPPVHYPPKPGKSQAVEHWASLAQFTRDKHSKNATNGYSQGMRGGGCLLLSWFYCKLQVWGFFFLFFFWCRLTTPTALRGMCSHVSKDWRALSNSQVTKQLMSCRHDSHPCCQIWFRKAEKGKCNVTWKIRAGISNELIKQAVCS